MISLHCKRPSYGGADWSRYTRVFSKWIYIFFLYTVPPIHCLLGLCGCHHYWQYRYARRESRQLNVYRRYLLFSSLPVNRRNTRSYTRILTFSLFLRTLDSHNGFEPVVDAPWGFAASCHRIYFACLSIQPQIRPERTAGSFQLDSICRAHTRVTMLWHALLRDPEVTRASSPVEARLIASSQRSKQPSNLHPPNPQQAHLRRQLRRPRHGRRAQ